MARPLRFSPRHDTWRDDLSRSKSGWIKSKFGYVPAKEYKEIRESSEAVGIIAALFVGAVAYIAGLYLMWGWLGGNDMPKSADALDYLISYIWTAIAALPFPWIPAFVAYYLFSEPLVGVRMGNLRLQRGQEADRDRAELERTAVATVDLERETVVFHT